MNEKWFNYAISLTVLMLMVNAFITIAATQPSADGTYNLFLSNMMTGGTSLDSAKTNSDFTIQPCMGDSSTSPTQEQGCTPIKRTDGQTVGYNAFDALIMLGAGVEIIMLSLATIFSPIAPIFYVIATIVFTIKGIALAWLGTMAVRQIFFGRVF